MSNLVIHPIWIKVLEKVCKIDVPSKANIMVWRLLEWILTTKEILATNDVLVRKGIMSTIHDRPCVFNSTDMKSNNNLLSFLII